MSDCLKNSTVHRPSLLKKLLQQNQNNLHQLLNVVTCNEFLKLRGHSSVTFIMQWGDGGVRFPGKQRYKGLRFNVSIITRGWLVVKFHLKLKKVLSLLRNTLIRTMGPYTHAHCHHISSTSKDKTVNYICSSILFWHILKCLVLEQKQLIE